MEKRYLNMLSFLGVIECNPTHTKKARFKCNKRCGFLCNACVNNSRHLEFVYKCRMCFNSFCILHYQHHIMLNRKYDKYTICTKVKHHISQLVTLNLKLHPIFHILSKQKVTIQFNTLDGPNIEKILSPQGLFKVIKELSKSYYKNWKGVN